MVIKDKIIISVSFIISGITSMFGIDIIDPPPSPPILDAVWCTTMKIVSPDYLNIGFTVLGAGFIVMGIFIFFLWDNI